ncbi:MAG: hypothetical protein AKCLJLPJ_02194 [Fimbriimonadales bacterium]|nr:MAG: GAF domain-containing protein [Armatimonadota bacterium]MBV6504094.1 hypothetical protein [Fimbriimonadales bacterium]MCE7900093.1 GAF domain-containing protein [Armatimonadetes bacterium ATM1]MDL1929396.1 GAF domain-containing protein [Fimbriimonadia bacterium ATM]MBC6968964.1 GAF domain-containing protein [Armatimonadota bacterium]
MARILIRSAFRANYGGMKFQKAGSRRYRRPWPSRLKATGHARPDQLQDRLRETIEAAVEHQAVADTIDRITAVLDELGPGTAGLQEIAEIAKCATKTDAAQIFLRDPDANTLSLAADTYEPEKVGRVTIRLGQGITGWAALHRRSVALSRDPWRDPRFLDYPGLDERRFQSLLCVPLIAGGELIGTVNVRTLRRYGYTAREANVLSRIAGQVARAIRQQSKVASLQQTAEHYETVSEVAGLISGSPYLEEILQLLVTFTAERLNYKVVTVRMLDEARDELVLRATQSMNYAYQRKRSIRVGESFAGRALATMQIVTSEDVTRDAEYIGADLAEEQGLKSMVCVPLIVRDRAIGVMTCYTERIRNFSRSELKTLAALAKQAAIAIEHAKLTVRTTLMQELHHRVKNNLQQVASLLRLQLAEPSGKPVEEMLGDTMNRITTIARVHDLLSREDLDRVGLRTLAEALSQGQQQALIAPGQRVEFDVQGGDIPLGTAQATQVALILNELMQNAIEHGFQSGGSGKVAISIGSDGDEVYLTVVNSGQKLADGFSIDTHSHLGLKIVSTLSRAIGGTFTLANGPSGVVAELRFPIESAELA